MDSRNRKGANPIRVHPPVHVPERLSAGFDQSQPPLPHRWALRQQRAPLSRVHERSFCLSVSGWIAPSAATLSPSPIRDATIPRGGWARKAIIPGVGRRGAAKDDRRAVRSRSPAASRGRIRALQWTCFGAAALLLLYCCQSVRVGWMLSCAQTSGFPRANQATWMRHARIEVSVFFTPQPSWARRKIVKQLLLWEIVSWAWILLSTT